MNELISALVDVINPPWTWVLGVVALLIVVGPRLAELRNDWLYLSRGRAQLELEKLRLEVLKLQNDVRQLAQQEQHAGIARELEVASPSTATAVTPPPSPPSPSKRRRDLIRFLARRPRLSRPLLWAVQVVMAYLWTMFAVTAVVFPFVGWKHPEFGPPVSLGLALVYAVLAWLSYRGFVSVRVVRREL